MKTSQYYSPENRARRRHRRKITRELLQAAIPALIIFALMVHLNPVKTPQEPPNGHQAKEKATAEQTLKPPPENAENENLELVTYENLGEFKITHYCTCAACCGKTDGITATGTMATPKRTVAVDPEEIPLGSTLLIDGILYVAEDTGGAIKGKKIDICVATHEEALQAGVKHLNVFIERKETPWKTKRSPR